MERHEKHCYKNPNRVPYEGELTYVGQTGKTVNYGESDDLPSGLSWIEWQEHDKMPKWWPGSSGMIFHEGQWYHVPGYSSDTPKGAHGCAGGPPPFDIWPTGGGVPLSEISAKHRWDSLSNDQKAIALRSLRIEKTA